MKYIIRCKRCGYYLNEDVGCEVYEKPFEQMYDEIRTDARNHLYVAHYEVYENEEFDFFKMFKIEEIEEIEEEIEENEE